MLEKISERLAKNLATNTTSEEVLAYGIEAMLATLATAICVFALAVATHNLKEMCVFVLSFFLIRSSAGGRHAKNYILCTVTYASVSMASILICKSISIYFIISLIICLAFNLISLVLIYIFAPAGSANRTLTKGEYIRFKKRSRRAVLISLLLAALLIHVNMTMAMIASCGTLFASSLVIKRKEIDYEKVL